MNGRLLRIHSPAIILVCYVFTRSSFVGLLAPHSRCSPPFAPPLMQVMISRCVSMTDWKLLEPCTHDQLRQKVSPRLLAEVRRLREVEERTMERDRPMVRAYLEELSTLQRHMLQLLRDYPDQLAPTCGTYASTEFNAALGRIAPTQAGLRCMLVSKPPVGRCDECGGLEPLLKFAVRRKARGQVKAGYRKKQLCNECADLDRHGLLYRPCTVCGLLYQPFQTEGVVDLCVPRSGRWDDHEGCPGKQCVCGIDTVCPTDVVAPVGPPLATSASSPHGKRKANTVSAGGGGHRADGGGMSSIAGSHRARRGSRSSRNSSSSSSSSSSSPCTHKRAFGGGAKGTRAKPVPRGRVDAPAAGGRPGKMARNGREHSGGVKNRLDAVAISVGTFTATPMDTEEGAELAGGVGTFTATPMDTEEGAELAGGVGTFTATPMDTEEGAEPAGGVGTFTATPMDET